MRQRQNHLSTPPCRDMRYILCHAAAAAKYCPLHPNRRDQIFASLKVGGSDLRGFKMSGSDVRGFATCMEGTPISNAHEWLVENPSESIIATCRIFKVPESTLQMSLKRCAWNLPPKCYDYSSQLVTACYGCYGCYGCYSCYGCYGNYGCSLSHQGYNR
ncbi:hypothetical protein GMDG_01142 [Pseudogymnoascus destructans 20631-21]|uniref:Uncharacterized protein n=1 Tax=Pseudogymnoascus destructans (strain ATCC MYA-4855 / 20631-21) TaxID=658429 RepID=L8FT76_PSED2|nr:hypothetical protein GMDG_01142 [Pseudogymnoascus destructans 20631-21]